jgi:hypothetical protein
MTHQRNIIKRLAAVTAVAGAFGAWSGPASASVSHNNCNPTVSCAGAQAAGSSARRARTSAHSVRWTSEQLEQLANAYKAKNPGWNPPLAAGALTTPAQLTWTPQALDALAAAYAALNPGWTRP